MRRLSAWIELSAWIQLSAWIKLSDWIQHFAWIEFQAASGHLGRNIYPGSGYVSWSGYNPPGSPMCSMLYCENIQLLQVPEAARTRQQNQGLSFDRLRASRIPISMCCKQTVQWSPDETWSNKSTVQFTNLNLSEPKQTELDC